MLTFCILLVKGDTLASVACLFSIIMGTGNISGSCINPAVTIAIIVMDLVRKRTYNIATYIAYIVM